MAATRDILIHHYGNSDLSTVWKIVNNDLPKTILEIEKILNDLEK